MSCSVPTAPANVLVLCLGNDIRSDDGVGWEVARVLTRVADTFDAPTDNGAEGNDAEARIGFARPKPLPPIDDEIRHFEPRIPGVLVRRSALSGFYLLDELIGFDRVIVVDAVKTGLHPPGTVLSFPFEALGTDAGPSPHAVGLPSVVRLGRQSGVILPTDIHIVAIEVDDIESIAEGLTAPVRAAVPRAVAEVRSLVAVGLP